MAQHPTIVLASASPRRKALLEALGFSISVCPTDIPEDLLPGEDPFEAAERLARAKAAAASDSGVSALVIAADTIVVLDGHALGKPEDAADAAAMLRRLSGRRHEVVTGVAVAKNSHLVSGREVSEVHFQEMTEKEVLSYASTPEPLDKAGAYALQGLASVFIEKVEGTPSNVIGLPVRLLRQLLLSQGVDLPFLTRRA